MVQVKFIPDQLPQNLKDQVLAAFEVAMVNHPDFPFNALPVLPFLSAYNDGDEFPSQEELAENMNNMVGGIKKMYAEEPEKTVKLVDQLMALSEDEAVPLIKKVAMVEKLSSLINKLELNPDTLANVPSDVMDKLKTLAAKITTGDEDVPPLFVRATNYFKFKGLKPADITSDLMFKTMKNLEAKPYTPNEFGEDEDNSPAPYHAFGISELPPEVMQGIAEDLKEFHGAAGLEMDRHGGVKILCGEDSVEFSVTREEAESEDKTLIWLKLGYHTRELRKLLRTKYPNGTGPDNTAGVDMITKMAGKAGHLTMGTLDLSKNKTKSSVFTKVKAATETEAYADELGDLIAKMEQFDMKDTVERVAFLKKTLTDPTKDTVPPNQELVVHGLRYDVKFKERSTQFTLTDKQALIKKIGIDAFIELATFKTEDLRHVLSENEMGKVGTFELTGPRRLLATSAHDDQEAA